MLEQAETAKARLNCLNFTGLSITPVGLLTGRWDWATGLSSTADGMTTGVSTKLVASPRAWKPSPVASGCSSTWITCGVPSEL